MRASRPCGLRSLTRISRARRRARASSDASLPQKRIGALDPRCARRLTEAFGTRGASLFLFGASGGPNAGLRKGLLAKSWRQKRPITGASGRWRASGPSLCRGKMTTPAQALRDTLRSDLRAAMRSRDTMRVSVLRTLIAAIDNAEAVALPEKSGAPRTRAVSIHVAVTGDGPSEVERRLLSKTELAAIIQAEVKALQSAAHDLRSRGAAAQADAHDAKAALVLSYAPSQTDED
jgi:uncharacterized protein